MIINERTFKSKADIELDFINSFEKPSNCEQIYCLVDSWDTSEKLINGCPLKGFNLIGALKSNRRISFHKVY